MKMEQEISTIVYVALTELKFNKDWEGQDRYFEFVTAGKHILRGLGWSEHEIGDWLVASDLFLIPLKQAPHGGSEEISVVAAQKAAPGAPTRQD